MKPRRTGNSHTGVWDWRGARGTRRWVRLGPRRICARLARAPGRQPFNWLLHSRTPHAARSDKTYSVGRDPGEAQGIVTAMNDDASTVAELHPKLQPIRAKASARNWSFEVLDPTKLTVQDASGPGFMSQAVTLVLGMLGLRRGLEPAGGNGVHTYLYSVRSNGHVDKERLWAPYRP